MKRSRKRRKEKLIEFSIPADKNKWLIVLKIVLSAIALFFAIKLVGKFSILNVLKETDIVLLLLSVVLYMLSQFLSSERLRLFMRRFRAGHHVTSLWNFKLYVIGMSYNLFIPGGIGGDAYKVVLYDSKLKTGKRKIIAGLILDRVVGLIGILIGIAALGFFAPEFHRYGGTFWFLPVLLIIFLANRLIRREYPRFAPVFFSALMMSLLVQLLQVLAFLALLWTTGLTDHNMMMSAVFLVSSVAIIVPVFLGGVGAREVLFAGLAPLLHYEGPDAVTAAILFSVVVVLTSLPGLVVQWIEK